MCWGSISSVPGIKYAPIVMVFHTGSSGSSVS